MSSDTVVGRITQLFGRGEEPWPDRTPITFTERDLAKLITLASWDRQLIIDLIEAVRAVESAVLLLASEQAQKDKQ